MKKTRRIIVAVVLMLATLLTFAGMPVVASTRSVSADAHQFDYYSDDAFLYSSIVFTSFNSKIVSAYVNFDMYADDYVVSDVIPTNGSFYCYYKFSVYYNNGSNIANIYGYSPQYTYDDVENASAENTSVIATGLVFDRSIDLSQYDNITRIIVTLELTSSASSSATVYYNYYRSLPINTIINN